MLNVSVRIAFLCLAFATLVECHKNDYVENTIKAYKRTVKYMTQNARLMNVDALLGLVIAGANIESLLYNEIPGKFKASIQLLDYETNQAINKIRPFLNNSRNDILLQSFLTTQPWRRSIKFGCARLNTIYFQKDQFSKLNTSTKYLEYLYTGSGLTKKYFLNCLVELLQQQKFCCVQHVCNVSDKCKNTMLADVDHMDREYDAAHQLLYLQVARSQQCSWDGSFVKEKIHEYCSYIYWELSQNYEFGFIDALNDLFLEQVTLCGYEGFTEFLVDDFIEHILSLQAESGCFTVDSAKQKKLFRRRKRESNVLDDGCIDHTTGVGIAALSTVLRYQLE